MMKNLLAGSSKSPASKYVATNIGRKDFNDDDFDFGSDDDDDDNAAVRMPAQNQNAGYDPKTAILGNLSNAPATRFADPNPSPRTLANMQQNNGQGQFSNMVTNQQNGVMVVSSPPPTNKHTLQTIDDSQSLDTRGIDQLNSMQQTKKKEASIQLKHEMKLAGEAQEKARTAAYQRRISQQIATDEIKKLDRFIAEADAAKKKQVSGPLPSERASELFEHPQGQPLGIFELHTLR